MEGSDKMTDIINVTSSDWNIIAPPGSWGGTVIYLALFVLLPIMLICIGMGVLWNIASYTRFKKHLVWLGYTFQWFMIGFVSLGVLAIPFGFLYWGYTQAKEGNVVPLKYAGLIILGYVVISTIGWLVNKYIVERVQKFEKELKPKKNKRLKTNIGY
jgi:hypothetical protein